MNLRRIKHTLLRLTAEEKVIGITAIIIVIATFMPWYSVVMNFDKKSMTETGFSGDLGVIGFVIFIMALITAIVLIAENMRLPLPQFGYKREQILFFFLGQSFFLTLLTMAIYTKRGLEFTDASLRFGIYTTLIAAFFGALSAFALIQKGKKQEVEAFFQHEEEGEEMAEMEQKEMAETVKKKPEPMPEPEPEPMFFEEDAEAMPEPEPELPQENNTEYIPEDDMIEDIQETPKKEPESQGDFFKRDAGIEEKHEAEKKAITDKGLGMNFYEDK
jgi:hypothetical protein